MAPLAERQPEVAVEDVERAAAHGHVDAQGAAWLARAMTQVTARVAADGQPGKDGVSVVAFGSEGTRDAHDELHPQALGEIRRLVGALVAGNPYDLLQSDDVGADLRDDVGNAIDVAATIEPLTAMDVVGRNDDLHAVRQHDTRGSVGRARPDG